MTKFYRVLKPTFMWEEGAIISDGQTERGYSLTNDIWEKVPLDGEYITRRIIEHEDNAEFFERVYPIGELKKAVFGNKIQAKAAAAAIYEGEK